MASSIDSTLDGDLTTTGQQVRKSELKQQFDAAVTDIEALQDGSGFDAGAIDTTDIADNAVASGKIQDDAVTYAKLQDVAANNVLLGNDDGAGSAAQELTKTEALALLNVEDGADVTDATNVNAAGATMNTDTDVSSNSWVLDEDDMSSDSATKVSTQQATKAYTDSFFSGLSQIQAIRKASDETVSASTTLQDDDELTFSIAANETVIVDCVLYITSNSTADFKAGWAVPSGATGLWGVVEDISHQDIGSSNSIAMDGTQGVKSLRAVVVNSSTPGAVTLQWAQDTSDAVDTVVETNSHMIVHRLA